MSFDPTKMHALDHRGRAAGARLAGDRAGPERRRLAVRSLPVGQHDEHGAPPRSEWRSRERFLHGTIRFAVTMRARPSRGQLLSDNARNSPNRSRSDRNVSPANIAAAPDWSAPRAVLKAGETAMTRLAGSTVPLPGSDVDCLAPRSAQAFRSSIDRASVVCKQAAGQASGQRPRWRNSGADGEVGGGRNRHTLTCLISTFTPMVQ